MIGALASAAGASQALPLLAWPDVKRTRRDMKKPLWSASQLALCLCACAPLPVHLRDGTTSYRVGCLSAGQRRKKAEDFCHGSRRLVDEQHSSTTVSTTGTRERMVYDYVTRTNSPVQVPVTGFDTVATGHLLFQCTRTLP
jgi:hypothetical protein